MRYAYSVLLQCITCSTVVYEQLHLLLLVLALILLVSTYLSSSARVVCFFIFFFFSSRRRHTRSTRDWSSDVCSSDLMMARIGKNMRITRWRSAPSSAPMAPSRGLFRFSAQPRMWRAPSRSRCAPTRRSEERRVGKEGRERVWRAEG